MCKYFAFAFEHFPGNVFPNAVCWERPRGKDRGKKNENKTNVQLNMCQAGGGRGRKEAKPHEENILIKLLPNCFSSSEAVRSGTCRERYSGKVCVNPRQKT